MKGNQSKYRHKNFTSLVEFTETFVDTKICTVTMKTSLTLSLALTAALFSKSSASSCHWGFSSEFFFPAPYIADLCNHFNGVGSSFMFTCANETRFSFYTPSWNDSGIYEYRGIMLGFNSDDCDFDTIYNYTWLNDSEAYCVGYEPPQTTEEILDSSCPVMEIGLEYYSNDGCNGVQYFDGAVYVAHWDFCEELHDDGSYWSVMTSKNNGYELGVYTDSSCAGTEFQNFDVPPGCGGTDGVSNQTYYTFSVYNDSDLYTTTGMGGGDMSTTASGKVVVCACLIFDIKYGKQLQIVQCLVTWINVDCFFVCC